MSDYLQRLNKVRVQNFRTKQKLLKGENDKSVTNVHLQETLQENLSMKEKETLEKVEEVFEVQDVPNLNKKRKASSRSDECDEQLEKDKNNRFSSGEESEGDSSDESYVTDDEEFSETPFIRDLKKWFFNNATPYSHLDNLLKTLKPYHPELPVCSKTFLKTSVNNSYQIEKFKKDDPSDESKIVYMGIAENIRRTIDLKLHTKNTIKLQFSVDGLPLFRSSSLEFWPLLGRIYDEEVIYEPFIITVHYGKGKPSCVKTYFKKFIDELNILLKDGIEIHDRHFDVEVNCFICDRPARSFAKCIKGHTGFYACERCNVKGYSKTRRVIFPVDELTNRSDDSFRLQENAEHHHDVSPLTLINPKIDMINQFVLDFMHLSCLGIMKKLLTESWVKKSKSKLSRNDILRISQRMMNLSTSVPNEFQRTTRSLGELGKWKATEFRFFLLYCGICVMKDILPDNMYKHFSLFAIACRILCTQNVSVEHAKYAQIYLERFVKLSQEFYGEEVLVLNMHSLIHLSDDVKNLKCSLNDITAFPFENKLGQVKKCVRSGKQPLEQLCRRVEQEKMYTKPIIIQLGLCKIKKEKKSKSGVEIKSMLFRNCELTTKPPNNCVLLKNNQVITVLRIHAYEKTEDLKKFHVEGKKLDILGPAVDYPLNSSILNLLQVKPSCNTEIIKATLSDVNCKMVYLPIFELPEDEPVSYVIPLLHMN